MSVPSNIVWNDQKTLNALTNLTGSATAGATLVSSGGGSPTLDWEKNTLLDTTTHADTDDTNEGTNQNMIYKNSAGKWTNTTNSTNTDVPQVHNLLVTGTKTVTNPGDSQKVKLAVQDLTNAANGSIATSDGIVAKGGVLPYYSIDCWNNRADFGARAALDVAIQVFTPVGVGAPANGNGGYIIRTDDSNGLVAPVFYVTSDGIVKLQPRGGGGPGTLSIDANSEVIITPSHIDAKDLRSQVEDDEASYILDPSLPIWNYTYKQDHVFDGKQPRTGFTIEDLIEAGAPDSLFCYSIATKDDKIELDQPESLNQEAIIAHLVYTVRKLNERVKTLESKFQ